VTYGCLLSCWSAFTDRQAASRSSKGLTASTKNNRVAHVDELLVTSSFPPLFNHLLIPSEHPSQDYDRRVLHQVLQTCRVRRQPLWSPGPSVYTSPPLGPASYRSLPRTLAEFRAQEGHEYRKARLHALWKQLLVALDWDDDASHADSTLNSGVTSYPVVGTSVSGTALTPASARQMRRCTRGSSWQVQVLRPCRMEGV